jgi:hypothetical protein
MFHGPEPNILLADNSIQMAMGPIRELHIVGNTLFMSCPSGKNNNLSALPLPASLSSVDAVLVKLLVFRWITTLSTSYFPEYEHLEYGTRSFLLQQ